MSEMIITDGCTGFPEKIGNKDISYCCTIHDLGGSGQVLQNCLNAISPTELWWIMAVAVGVGLMKLFRPIYNLLQKWGWLPKTPGSNF